LSDRISPDFGGTAHANSFSCTLIKEKRRPKTSLEAVGPARPPSLR
jgi:hypothetical protein